MERIIRITDIYFTTYLICCNQYPIDAFNIDSVTVFVFELEYPNDYYEDFLAGDKINCMDFIKALEKIKRGDITWQK